jgi:hypothetical protein
LAAGYDGGVSRLAALRRLPAVLGQVLGAATRTASVLRRADKPLHPAGSVSAAVLHRFGGGRSGVAWLDGSGEDEVLVRQSRSVGLPRWAPDIFGLAVRVPAGPERSGDLLFSNTGLGPLSRFLLLPSRSLTARAMGTLLPYRTSVGPLLLSAVHHGSTTVALSWARGTGPWHRFATLTLADPPSREGDAPVSFDPVRNTVPGLDNYDWVRRLREPSYAAARRSRGLSG